MTAHPVRSLVRLGLEVRTWSLRGGYGRNRERVHLVTDLHDDGQSLCGRYVGDLVAMEGTVRVLQGEAPSHRPWSTAECERCLRERIRLERLQAYLEEVNR